MAQKVTNIDHTAALYDASKSSEETRLAMHPVEREVTLRTILQYLEGGDNTSRKRIADIGGATGGHAFPLAERGHQVHLVDISPQLVKISDRQSRV